MEFPKKQGQRLIPDYLLDYATELHTNHPDPTESWGGSGGSDYTAGNGIEINNNVISVDNTVAKKSEIPTNYVTLDTEQTITGLKTIGQTNGTLSEVDFSGFTFKLVNKAINSTEAEIKISNSSYGGYQHPNIYSSKGLYVNLAKIKLGDDGNNTYGITMPDSTTWESDKVLATTSDIPSLDGYATQTWVQEQGYAKSSSLATVATSGSYNDLIDKPTIPDTSNFVTTDTNQAINGDKIFTAPVEVKDVMAGSSTTVNGHGSFIYKDTGEDKVIFFSLPRSKTGGTEQNPTKYTLATIDDIPNVPTLATVATTGSYNDLLDKPTIPDTTKMVTTDTTQTISGSKYFDPGKLIVKRSSPVDMTLIFTPDTFSYSTGNSVKRFKLPISKPGGTDTPTEYTLATTDDIVDATNFVTLDTNQTISGSKTFQGVLSTENTTFGMKMDIVPSRFAYTYNNQGTIESTLFDLPTGKPSGTEGQPTTYTLATSDDIHNPTITFTQGGTTKGTITLNQSGDQTIEFDAGGSSGGGKLYLHKIRLKKGTLVNENNKTIGYSLYLYNNITTSSNQPMSFDTFKQYFTSDTLGSEYGFATSGKVYFSYDSTIVSICCNNNFVGILNFQVRNGSANYNYTEVKFDSVDRFEDIVTEV